AHAASQPRAAHADGARHRREDRARALADDDARPAACATAAALVGGAAMSVREPSRFVAGRWLRIRTWMSVTLLIAAFGILGYRAFVLQVREAERLRAMAEDQYLRDVEIPPRRGRILDRNGIELAASAEVDSLACN